MYRGRRGAGHSGMRNMRKEPLRLPECYRVLWDPDLPTLRRPDGSVVAAFSATGMNPEEVERAAEEDAREIARRVDNRAASARIRRTA